MQWSLEHGMMVRRVGRGPRIVWIHGLGESSVSFEPIIARMPAFEHVLVDLPGYGRSPWPDTALGIDETADHLARWLPPDATLVGHSMGGVLATFVAERNTTVRAVVDIDGNLSRGDCTFSSRVLPHSVDDFRARGFAELRAQIYADGATSAALRGYFAALMFASPDAYFRQSHDLVSLCLSDQLAPRLAALRVPTLFIAGGMPEGISAESRTLLDHHRIRWLSLEPSGHWVYVDQPERFAAELAGFVTEVGPTASSNA